MSSVRGTLLLHSEAGSFFIESAPPDFGVCLVCVLGNPSARPVGGERRGEALLPAREHAAAAAEDPRRLPWWVT